MWQTVMVYALLPASALVVSSIVPTFWRPSSKAKSAIQHLAAGVVFAVAAVEFLPEVRAELAPVPLAVSFLAGVVFMLSLETLTHQATKLFGREPGSGETTFLLAVGIDLFLDGLLLGIGFSLGHKEGTLLAFALALEGVTLGLALATAMLDAGCSSRAVFGRITGFATVLLVGAAAGGTLLAGLPREGVGMVMSFGLAALLYLVTEELLVKAHAETDTPFASAMFFVGFLAFVLLGGML